MKNSTLKIEITNIPTIIKFTSSDILASGSHQYNNIDEAKNSPLAVELFNFPFVKEIFISENYVSVTKNDLAEWNEI
ncbi:MAG: NifU N-terminal domain-containing protein, partial [Lutibacter sp.]|nr:NifU N-terminal domain-containing protein [Lutibacter sp.]